MVFKTFFCFGVMALSCLAFARDIPQLWNSDTLSLYDNVLSSDRTVPQPWTLGAIEILEKVKNGTVTERELDKLLSDRVAAHAPVQECAEAIILLYAIRDNQKDYFLKEYAFFQEDYPKSVYTPLLAPSKFLRKCPTCGGKCIRSVNCKTCKNTLICTTCKGKGVHVIGGMRSTKRRYVGASSIVSDDGDSRSRSYRSSSSRSGYQRTGSHTTRNYDPRYVKEFVADEKELPCVKCQGTAVCVACAPMRKKQTCKTCQTSGYVSDEGKVGAMLKDVAEKGIQVVKGIKDDDVKRWQDSAAFKAEFQKTRTENDIVKLQSQVTALVAQYPSAIQRQTSERFLQHLRNLQREIESAQTKQAEEERLIAADSAALKEAIKASEFERGCYKRKEALMRLNGRFPKASNRAELKAALTLCEDEIARQEDELRNALRLLETLEDLDAGIERANKLVAEIDPVSPLQSTVMSVRADLIARKAKEKRKSQYIMIGIGLGVLVLVYFLFDLLYGIYQTQKNKRFY